MTLTNIKFYIVYLNIYFDKRITMSITWDNAKLRDC